MRECLPFIFYSLKWIPKWFRTKTSEYKGLCVCGCLSLSMHGCACVCMGWREWECKHGKSLTLKECAEGADPNVLYLLGNFCISTKLSLISFKKVSLLSLL